MTSFGKISPRVIIVFLIVLFLQCRGQGVVNFANRVFANSIDAPVTFTDGTGVGKGYFAQLFAGPNNSSASSLQPVLPTTTFRDLFPGYIAPIDVSVPGIAAG